MSTLNYRHLHYFWVVAKEGGFARAADRLGMAVQTISAQVRELERSLGHQLLKPEGRGLVLTEAGQAAFARAEEIFQIGQMVPNEVHEAATQRVQRLSVGLSDGLSKLAAHALLAGFKQMIEKFDASNLRLCAHNGKEFDYPYLCRRMLINSISLPAVLNLSGKRGWEVPHLDTMELWKFGDYKAYTSLALLCHIFKIPTPKDDISGADVARVYYEEGDLNRIRIYCEKDVIALIQLFLKMNGEPLVEEGEIYIK